MGKSYFSIAWKMPCKKTMDMGGAPPHTDNLIRSAAGGRRPNRTVEKTRRVRVLALSSPLATLGRSWTRRAQTRARLTWKPARWTLTTKPTIGGGLRLCQSRNGATNPTIAEELSRWRPAAVSSLHTRTTEGARAEHVTPETKNSRGKRNQRIEPALNPFKQVQTEFLILTELVKIWSECSNKTYVFVRDLLGWLVKLWNRKNIILSPTVTLKTFVCLCVCMSTSSQLIHLC